MDTGNNGQMLNHEHRVDCRSQGPDPGLPGRVRPVERPADHRRHQERHQPVPRLGLRPLDRLRLEHEPLGQRAERRREAEVESKTLRLLHRRSGRQAGRQQQAVLLLRHEYRPTNQAINSGNPIRLRVPTALERAGDFSQTLDNNGAPFNFIKDPIARPARVSATDHGGCFPTAACSARFRPTASTRLGLAILNRYPLPNLHADAGHQLQLRARRRGSRLCRPSSSSSSSRPSGSTTSSRRSCASPASTPASGSACSRDPGTIPGFTDVLYARIRSSPTTRHGQLHAQPDDLHRRHLRHDPQRAGGRQRERHPDERLVQPSERPGGLPAALSGRGLVPKGSYAYEVLQDVKPPFWDGTRMNLPPTFSWGGRIGAAPPEPALPWLAEHQPDAGRRGQR